MLSCWKMTVGLTKKIFNEYTSLSLRYPPRFSQVSTEEEALILLANIPFDLVICMPGIGDNDAFSIGRHIKACYSHLPIVVLTPFSHGITKRIANEDLSAFDIYSVGSVTRTYSFP